MPGGRYVGEEGFRSQESDGYVMTQGFRQDRAARERNTLRPVFCVLYELDDDELMIYFLWVPPRPLYRPRCRGLQVREDIYSDCYMESGRLRSLDIRNPYPHLDPDPRRNLPTSSRALVRRVVVQSSRAE